MEEKLTKVQQERQADQYSPLVLAYMGDVVFEIFVREQLVKESNMPVNKLHHAASSLVKAQAQSRMIQVLEEELTEKEASIYRRGRNAKSNTSAKNASILDYRRATGFEALLGYLYLNKENDRLLELMEKAVRSERKNERKKF